jgi:hypothetical protein
MDEYGLLGGTSASTELNFCSQLKTRLFNTFDSMSTISQMLVKHF